MTKYEEINQKAKQMEQLIKNIEKMPDFNGRVKTIKKARKVYYSIREDLEKDGSTHSLYHRDLLKHVNNMLVEYGAMDSRTSPSIVFRTTYRSTEEIESYLNVQLDIIKYKMSEWRNSYFL